VSRDPGLYLDDILQAIARIHEYVQGLEYDDFERDRKTFDAVVRNLEVIGEAARALPDSVKQQSSQVEWPKLVGLRNILIHQYFGISARIVWDLVCTRLRPLETVCKELSDSSTEDPPVS